MRRSSAGLCVVCASAALVATPAFAAPPWAPPSSLAPSSGLPAAIWSSGAGSLGVIAPSLHEPTDTLTRLRPTGAAASSGSTSLVGVSAAAYARDRLVVLGDTRDDLGTVGGPGGTVAVAFGSAQGRLDAPRTLTSLRGAVPKSLAANTAGVMAAVVRSQKNTVLLYRRPAGGAFRRALALRMPYRGSAAASVAVGPAGDILMAWEHDRHIYARHLGPTGRSGPTHELGDSSSSAIQTLVDGSGRLTVAWESQRIAEGDAHGPALVSLATAQPGHGFGPQRRISSVSPEGSGRGVATPGVRLVGDGSDRALLVFQSYDRGRYVVRALTLSDGHRGAAQTVSPVDQDSVLAAAAAVPGGPAVVLWRSNVAGTEKRDPQAPVTLQGAVRPGGLEPFGAPERISGDDGDVTGAVVAFDQDIRVPVAVWGVVAADRPTQASGRRLPSP